MEKLCLTLCFYIFLALALPVKAELSKKYEARGYITDVNKEREERYEEIFWWQFPRPSAQKPLSELIFNARLSKEFKERYEEKFGRSEAERTYYHPNQYTTVQLSTAETQNGVVGSVEIENRERRSFAEYMLKRLAEYHVDNYAKSDPAIRPMWELKDKISKVNVEVAKGYKFDVNYSFSGNYLDLYFDNPYVDSKLNIQMDPNDFGPSEVQESRWIIGRAVNPKTYVESVYTTQDGIFLAVIRRQIKPGVDGSLLGSTFTHNGGTSTRESKGIVAVTFWY